ncbi:sensor histidine kinase [Actinophytocola xinjiangensis]|uniref:sensor histidine kinase n=1 Tax=Actinophytocola xinjiangensis TaxID=485602 RepID=UPI0013903F86|nr:nitrate- and nitrite sensing domain-containing protein [Actinophytocola xinjiangensis]
MLIPSAALLVIGVGASGYLVKDGYDAQEWATTMQDTVAPGTAFAAGAQEERRVSLQLLGGDRSVIPELTRARADFDRAVANIQGLMGGLNDLNPGAIEEANKIFPKLIGEQLPQIRQGVDAGVVPWADVNAYYSGVVELIKLGLQGIAETAPDSKTAVEESTATTLFAVADSMSRAHAVAIGGVVRGGLSVEEYQEFSSQVGRYQVDMQAVIPILTPELQQRFGALAETPEFRQLAAQESALRLRGPSTEDSPGNGEPLPLNLEQWQRAASAVSGELLDIYSEHHRYAEGFAAETGETTFVNSLLGGGAVLLITLIATFVAIRLSNRVVRRMKNLRAETLELADTKLPMIVGRLRGGEQIDLAREMPPLDYGRDELGEVAQAFNKAQRTAVAAAAHEAEIQNGFRTVFLNIAHRSQVVVRRQLEVLDKAEREQEDPEALESLFQLDHLATRARRNAENLLILGGERPGRRWRNPVPLVEIVRSAIGETEHYKRVHTGRLPEVHMLGSVVADLIHLLAELVDNATAFSPPDAKVEVRGNRVGNGVVVEVEDQGVGIPSDECDDINAFLQNPPDFDVMALTEEARLGLFVVSQLSARHGVSVTLVDSVYGGIRAIVLVRSALIASDPEDDLPRAGLARNGDGPARLPRQRQLDTAPPPEIPVQAAPPTTPPSAAPSVPPPAVPAQAQPPFPNDLAGPEDINEQTVQWSARDLAAGAPPPGNGIGRQRGRSAQPGPADRGDDKRPPLPRRRRQANLAPQLTGEFDALTPPAAESENPEADAEQSRNRLSAFQRGTREGRAAP